MNEHTRPLSTIGPEVRDFLAAVRSELADLDPDELTEITDGLEADLADLVAERGPDALGDPKAYARELRTAAGITEVAPRRTRRPARDALMAYLDACHAWFDHQVGRVPGDPEPVLAWLRPAWWILRAVVAAHLVCLVLGFAALGTVGLGLTLLAVLGSIQLGRGRLWPGGRRGLLARLVLLGLNLFALAVAVPVLAQAGQVHDYSQWDRGWRQGYDQARAEVAGDVGGDPERAGIYADGRRVTNIYPYDAQGRRLAGVQLFDQDGKPLDAAGTPQCPKGTNEGDIAREDDGQGNWTCFDYTTGERTPGLVFYPWTNGQAQLLNVFPLAERGQESLEPSPTAFQEADKPTLGIWPFAEVPTVSLPGITSGVLAADAAKPAVPAEKQPSR